MKKRKTYEISVIDKTYSKTISDETKFYTSDTVLELGFELKETEYTFESAEIVLLNIDDRSLTTRPVSKVNNDFVYEIDDDITTHYGEWRGQLMLVEKGEVHVSSPIKFRIENDLYSNKPLEITEVVSWVSLKKYANVLVDELKQAVEEVVANVEAMDDTFKANELDRDKTEKERQSRFENAESERDETFESNETTRQTQELEREKAEATRQTIFDGNEANRTETFNANEATRQENETTRQQAEGQRRSTFESNEAERQTTFETAEQERQSAEIIRVENENQRKIDHANRSAELDGKADKVVLKNLIKNGDFSDGLLGWSNFRATSVMQDGKVLVTTDGSGDFSQLHRNFAFNQIKDHKYYGVSSIRLLNSVATELRLYVLGDNVNGRISKPEQNIDYLVSGLVTATTDSNTKPFITRIIYPSDSIANGKQHVVNFNIVLDLTDIFGAGNEPAQEEMDKLIKITGYIGGEYALNNKEMLIWTLALIRRNKNAIVALGGTI